MESYGKSCQICFSPCSERQIFQFLSRPELLNDKTIERTTESFGQCRKREANSQNQEPCISTILTYFIFETIVKVQE